MSPQVCCRISAIKPREVVSIPLEAERMGVEGSMKGAAATKAAREYWTGTAWMMYVGEESVGEHPKATDGSVVATTNLGSVRSFM